MVEFVSASKKKKQKGSRLVQVVSFFVAVFCPFPLFSALRRGGPQSFTEEQRNDFTPDTAGRVRHNRCPFTLTIIPVTPQALFQISSVFVFDLSDAAGRSPSHLDTRAVEMQHLGSHSLYAAHDLFLMAHQRDPQAHHVPGRQDNTSINALDHSTGQNKWDLQPQLFHYCEKGVKKKKKAAQQACLWIAIINF